MDMSIHSSIIGADSADAAASFAASELPSSVKTAAQALDEFMEALELDRRSPLVVLDDTSDPATVGVKFFDRAHPGFEYDFYCNSKPDALRWVAHMAPKTWVTKEHLEVFARLMLDYFAPKPKREGE